MSFEVYQMGKTTVRRVGTYATTPEEALQHVRDGTQRSGAFAFERITSGSRRFLANFKYLDSRRFY